MRSYRSQFLSFLTPAVFGVLLLGLAIHFVGFLAIQPFWRELQPVRLPEAHIRIQTEEQSSGGLAEAQYALLNDSAPLFIPTRWNYLSRMEFDGYQLPEPEPLFEAYPPRVSSEVVGNQRFEVHEGDLENGAERMLEFPPTSYFEGLGRRPVTVAALPERTAAYLIENLLDGERVLSGSLTRESLPLLPESAWQPVTFLLFVESMGGVGRPLPVGGSGNETVDRQLQDWLGQAEFWKTLKPGYYRIHIGP